MFNLRSDSTPKNSAFAAKIFVSCCFQYLYRFFGAKLFQLKNSASGKKVIYHKITLNCTVVEMVVILTCYLIGFLPKSTLHDTYEAEPLLH